MSALGRKGDGWRGENTFSLWSIDRSTSSSSTRGIRVIRIEKGYPAGSQMNGAATVHIRGLSECIGMKKAWIGAQMSCRLTRVEEKRGRVGQPPVDAHDPAVAGLRRVRRSEH